MCDIILTITSTAFGRFTQILKVFYFFQRPLDRLYANFESAPETFRVASAYSTLGLQRC